jgi:ketosteroid isomerase-like protein
MIERPKRTAQSELSRRAAALFLAAAFSAATTTAACAAEGFNKPADVSAIISIENALATQTHMKNLVGYYAPDALVIDIMAPGIYRGRKQIADAFDAQFVPVASMHTDMLDTNIASDGTFACAALRLKFTMAMKNGTTLVVSTRQLDAFKKIDGAWKIVQEHISVPADAKTGLAVMNGALPVRGPIAWSANPIPGPSTSPENAKAAIRTWMNVGALSTNIDELVSYYGPCNDVLVFDSFYPGEIRGLRELHDYYAPLMASFSAIKVKMPLFVAASDGKFGIEIDTQDMKLSMKNGTTKYISLRQSDCLRRVDGSWKSFFEMISFAVAPSTGKAIIGNSASFAAK